MYRISRQIYIDDNLGGNFALRTWMQFPPQPQRYELQNLLTNTFLRPISPLKSTSFVILLHLQVYYSLCHSSPSLKSLKAYLVFTSERPEWKEGEIEERPGREKRRDS